MDIKVFMFAMYLVLSANVYAGVQAMYSTSMFEKVLFGASACVSTLLFFERDVFLPFLGHTVMPQSVIVSHRTPAGANRTVRIRVTPNTRVVYWASEPSYNVVSTPQQAYGKYNNAGVETSDDQGYVMFRVRSPSSYKTWATGKLAPHVHYRMMKGDGMWSRIFTKYLPAKHTVVGI